MVSMDESFGQALATAVIMQYEKLKKTGKPQGNEGTALAGFVLTESGREGTRAYTSKKSNQLGMNKVIKRCHNAQCTMHIAIFYAITQCSISSSYASEFTSHLYVCLT